MSIEASFVGNLGKDVVFDPDKAEGMSKFSVAVRKKNRETGAFDTNWMNVVCFKFTAQDAKHLKKGDRVYVSGDLWPRIYQADGFSNVSFDVVAKKVYQLKKGEKEAQPQEEFKAETPILNEVPF